MERTDSALAQQLMPNSTSQGMASPATATATKAYVSHQNGLLDGSPHLVEATLIGNRSTEICDNNPTPGLSTKRSHDGISHSYSLEGEVSESSKRVWLGDVGNTLLPGRRGGTAGGAELEDSGDDCVNTGVADVISKLNKEGSEQKVDDGNQAYESDDVASDSDGDYSEDDDIPSINCFNRLINELKNGIAEEEREKKITELNQAMHAFIDIEKIGIFDVESNIEDLNRFLGKYEQRLRALKISTPRVKVHQLLPNDNGIPEECSLSTLALGVFLKTSEHFKYIVSFWKTIYMDLAERNVFNRYPIFLLNDRDDANQLSLGFPLNSNPSSILKVPLWGEAKEAGQLCKKLKKEFNDYAVAISG